MDIRLRTLHAHGRQYIGICASQNHVVGLFEIFYIQQDSGQRVDSIVWIRAVKSPLQDWVRPQAELEDDLSVYDPVPVQQIRLLCDNHLYHDPSGEIQLYQVAPATLQRLPYSVCFWEDSDSYPVFTIHPENRLPWRHTVRSAFRLPYTPLPIARQHAPRILENDAVCAISLEPLTDSMAHWAPCGHAFSEAIFRALETAQRCPLCRAPCNAEDIQSP